MKPKVEYSAKMQAACRKTIKAYDRAIAELEADGEGNLAKVKRRWRGYSSPTSCRLCGAARSEGIPKILCNGGIRGFFVFCPACPLSSKVGLIGCDSPTMARLGRALKTKVSSTLLRALRARRAWLVGKFDKAGIDSKGVW